ncbi:acetyl-CoA acetyltransferase [Bacillus velezensis]|nr:MULTISPECIES: acetyl-CoA C-acyltransferase [Bacillus]AIU81172.1 Putative acetyl-CoA C-acetyltransferase YhfS [Bacillus velezensis]ATD76164.1 Putative acetyl-CoA C-acetyltransferase YhfS [Bacillus velezensis]ATV22186.1 acetyl-CoA C-acyltransferase [Bacillus sp. Lzh-5]AWQ16315.1 acetyl-CoA C-acyltransferase [Bacillus velezensis]AYV18620.1 acetyl-CoA C-acyltransferase [Bacillus velezensis]
MEAVITDAKRTIFARENGLLKDCLPEDLAAPLIRHLSRNMPEDIDEVLIGNATGRGGNLARLSALAAGLPLSVSGTTIDRQCGSGLDAVRVACHFVKAGAGSMYIAGGAESSSRSPFSSRARFSPEHIGDPDMGIAAEYTAQAYGVTRKMQDEYALLSYERSVKANEDGLYRREILPCHGFAADENMLKKRNMEPLISRAKPVFQSGGSVTAANSCGISDGAAAVCVMEEQKARSLGLKPRLRFIGSAVSGVHPHYPSAAPVYAVKKLLKERNLSPDDIDIYEINEAFAVKICVFSQQLQVPYSKINVRGGALAVGHPYGASGAALVTRLFYEAKRRPDARYAAAAIGSGGGVGLALLFEVLT